MTTWNYRVIRKAQPTPTFQIHEVYYRADGSIDCWTQQPVEPLGTSEAQLRNDIHAFLAAFRLPVLEEQQRNGKTLLQEQQPSGARDDLRADYVGRVDRAATYLFQMLGNHELLREDPALRHACDQFDAALTTLRDTAARAVPAPCAAVAP